MAFLNVLARPLVGALFAVLLGACGDDASSPSDGGPAEMPADDGAVAEDADTVDPEDTNGGCTGELALCDIREPDCQRSIAEEVACLRGSELLMPGVRVLTKEQYLDALSHPDGMPDIITERWLEGLADFGLAASGTTPDEREDIHASHLGAQYQYATSDIVVIDHGLPLDDYYAVSTLAHEIVHAQQDTERDLMAWTALWSTSDDRLLAAMSIYEGEAVHFQQLVQGALRGEAPSELDWDALYGEWQEESYAWLDSSESAYGMASLVMPYAFGGAFVTDAWLRDGRAGIDALYEQPPRSTHAILFGSDEGEAQAELELHAAALPQFAIQYRPVNFGVLGAFMFRAFLRRAGASEEEALRAAESLGADIFSVQINGDTGELVSVWRMQLLEGADTAWLDDLELAGFAVLDEPPLLTFVAGPPEVLSLVDGFQWLPVPAQP